MLFKVGDHVRFANLEGLDAGLSDTQRGWLSDFTELEVITLDNSTWPVLCKDLRGREGRFKHSELKLFSSKYKPKEYPIKSWSLKC